MKFIPSRNALRRLPRDEAGSGAVEFALVMTVLSALMLNGIELARFAYAKMQLQNATQMAAQAVWKTCDTAAESPVTINCAGRTTAIANALQSTSLGAHVTLSSGFPTEAYYCAATIGGALTSVGPVTSAKPANCSPTGNAADTPGNYVVVQAQYTYRPLYRGVSVGSLMRSTLTASTTMRIQ